jgi:hypothetical protein
MITTLDCHGLPHEPTCLARRFLPILSELFLRHPIVGSRVRDLLTEPVNLDLDSPETIARVLRDRALKLREAMPIPSNNLLIAQHRDILRYAHKRSGNY